MEIYWDIPGKRLQFANLSMAIEIVDVPSKNGDFLKFFVCLPEGTSENLTTFTTNRQFWQHPSTASFEDL